MSGHADIERRPDIKHLTKPIIFIHIEKTAGTAFTNFLYDNLGCGWNGEFKAYQGGHVSEYVGDGSRALYYGHMEYAPCRKAGIPGYYITFLRHPLNRAISQYRSWHNKENLTHYWLDFISKEEADAVRAVQEMTFQEYVMSENPLIFGHIRDLMSRRLTSDQWSVPSRLDDAFDMLSQEFHYFGLVESFEKSIELFDAAFSNVQPYGVRDDLANISNTYDDTLDEAGQQRLRDLNVHDFKLYDSATALFNWRYHQMTEHRT